MSNIINLNLQNLKSIIINYLEKEYKRLAEWSKNEYQYPMNILKEFIKLYMEFLTNKLTNFIVKIGILFTLEFIVTLL